MSARDLQFRARRFVIAVLVTSVVFGIALAIDAMRRSVEAESASIVAVFGADEWIVADGATGPFTTTRVLGADTADEVRSREGVERADAVVLSRTAIQGDPPVDVNLIGHVPRGIGTPRISAGRPVRERGEVVLSGGTSTALGERVVIGGKRFHVVGTTSGSRYYFGVPTVFMALDDAQRIVFGGQPLAMAVAVEGTTRAPAGTVVLDNDEVAKDLDRPSEAGFQSIVVMAILMWVIAAGIIGLIVYLSAIERTRDFAVFKATGAPTRVIMGGLVLQAVAVALAAALLAVGVSLLVAKGLPVQTSLNGQAVVQLLVISIAVGVLASIAGVRRALGTDPALAFGGR